MGLLVLGLVNHRCPAPMVPTLKRVHSAISIRMRKRDSKAFWVLDVTGSQSPILNTAQALGNITVSAPIELRSIEFYHFFGLHNSYFLVNFV